MDDEDNRWEKYAEFKDTDVHYQVSLSKYYTFKIIKWQNIL